MSPPTAQEHDFLVPGASAALSFVGPRAALSSRELARAIRTASGDARARLQRFLAPLADTGGRRNNWQALFCTRVPLAAFLDTPERAAGEATFDGSQVSWHDARAHGGPMLQSFLRALEAMLTEPARHAMRFIVCQRRLRAPWHTDNNDEARPFRRFAVTIGEPTQFLDVRDLPRFGVLGGDTDDYETWRVDTGVPDLAEHGVVHPIRLARGVIYSWGHDEWHKTPDAARDDDLIIVGELHDEV